jgi:hypothetical protein
MSESHGIHRSLFVVVALLVGVFQAADEAGHLLRMERLVGGNSVKEVGWDFIVVQAQGNGLNHMDMWLGCR